MFANKMKRKIRDEEISLRMDRIWRPVFDKYDTDHDGQIPLDDFKQMLDDANNELRYDIPYEVLEEIGEKIDLDKSKTISFDEFIGMLNARDLANEHPLVSRLITYATLITVPRAERRSVQHRYLDEYRCIPIPFSIFTLSLLQLGFFVYNVIKYGGVNNANISVIDDKFVYNPHRRAEIWRFFTYMFVHVGFLHVFVNVLFQLILGIPLEMVHKWWRVAIVYCAGVISGSLGAAITDSRSYLAGGSGGAYALITAHLANVILNWKEMEFAWARLGIFSLFTGADLFVALYERYYASGSSRTSYAAHLAGGLSGLLIGLFTLRNLRVRKCEQILQLVALALFVFLAVTAIVYNIMMTPPFDDRPW